ncbi:MAG: AMP-binding protein [Alphaproteobacteria bacterium]|nr:AMP-binding protein [Alphaproteobacteria bacterium]
MDDTYADVIRRNARRYRDVDAFVCGDRKVTHGEFLEQATRIARAFTASGIRPQDRISILSMNSVEYSLLYGACELAGFIAATINFRLAGPEIASIVEESQPSVLFFEGQYAEMIGEIRDRLSDVADFVVIDGEVPEWATGWGEYLARGDDETIALHDPQPDDLAYLIYTSGTTGRPKGVMHDHKYACALALHCAEGMNLGSHDRLLLMMPLFHIGAKAIGMAQQWYGGTVHLHRAFDPLAILTTIERERITATHLAPTLIQGLLDVPNIADFDTSSLKSLIYSAASMPPALLARGLEAFGPIFVQMYGQTEGILTILPKSAHVLDGNPVTLDRLASVGHAFIGTEVTVRDEHNQEVPVGEVGELCTRGDMIMRGYWNNQPGTIAALEGGWLHSGDIGRMDEGGYFWMVDRKKDMIVSGGENIYSREVEEALMTHPAVHQAAVVAKPDPKWGESVCAIVALRPDESVSEEALIAHCRQQIAAYKRPRSIIFIDAMPLLANGKINKVALREQYIGRADTA